MSSDQTGLELAGERHLHLRRRPAQSVADHVVETATQYILALQTARQKVGPHESFAQREEPVGEDEVVNAPTAAVEPLGVIPRTDESKASTRPNRGKKAP